MIPPVLTIEGLAVDYHVSNGRTVRALTDVDLTIGEAETVGVVGESGCGKSTLLWSILRLLPANGEISGGSVRFRDQELTMLDPRAIKSIRGRDIAMIFQDPLTSLNPTFTVGHQLSAVVQQHAREGSVRGDARQRIIDTLTSVGIPDARERMDLYPHEFSGGMRQRIVIAMALLLEPTLILADEPTSSLDVTLEAQSLELLKRLQKERGTSILFVSHDLGVVSEICDRITVMYAGRVVEEGSAAEIFADPRHPYTHALLAATPSHTRRGSRVGTIPGRVPMLSELPEGCTFSPRCSFAHDACRTVEPLLRHEGGRRVRCVLERPVFESGSAPIEAVSSKRPTRSHGDSASSSRSNNENPLSHRTDTRHTKSTRLTEPAHTEVGAPLVTVRGLQVHFGAKTGPLRRATRRTSEPIRAIDGVDLDLLRGEIMGLVGESGSGKTTLGRSILRLVLPTAGEVDYDGHDVAAMRRVQQRRFRREAQMIFQDAHASLSPRLSVEDLLTEPYVIHKIPDAERRSVRELLEMVELSVEHTAKRPHELSGGQARRIGIARALALQPSLIVADEPTAGLDVSAAASILNLMKDLREQLNLTYLLITHNLDVAGQVADRIAVMYLGQLVEIGSAEAVFAAPAHPYTQALFDAAVERVIHGRRAREHRLLLPGEIPSPKNPPSGCRFHTRCPYAQERSRTEVPVLEEVAPGHLVACHFWREIRDQRAPVGRIVLSD